MSNLGEVLKPEEIQVTGKKKVKQFSILIFRSRIFRPSQAMIDEADMDGDGQINYEEFYLMMQSA